MHYNTILEYARTLRKNPTSAEQAFWDKVRGRKFLGLKFNRQYVIQHANMMGMKSYFIADFHCYEKQLLVEIDGEIHQHQIEYDQIRENILLEMGYHLIRFTNHQVLNQWSEVEAKLKSCIATIS